MSDAGGGRGVTSLTSFLTALGINVVIGAIAFAIFATCRLLVLDVYQPRWQSLQRPAEATDFHEWMYSDSAVYPWMLKAPSRNPFKLLWQIITYEDAQLVAAAGVDAYTVMRICRLGMFYFGAIAGLYGFAVLLPLNLIGDEPVSGTLEEISIARVGQNSRYLWAHAVSVYVFTFGLILLIIRTYRKFLPVRYTWLSIPQAASYSVLVVDLPSHVVDDASLMKLAEELYPKQVECVCMATRSDPLEAAFSQRERAAVALQQQQHKRSTRSASPTAAQKCMRCGRPPAPASQLTELSRRVNALRALGKDVGDDEDVDSEPLVSDGGNRCCSCRTPLDGTERTRRTLALGLSKGAIALAVHAKTAWAAAARSLVDSRGAATQEVRVASLFSRALRKGVYQPTSAGFITFRSLTAAQVARQVQHAVPSVTGRAGTLMLPAPHPRDINWNNVELSHVERKARQRVVFLLILAITATYTIPIAAISTLTALSSLTRVLPAAGSFVDANPALKSFIEGFLPTLALRIFLAVMPLVTRALALYGGARSESEKRMDSFRLYFLFQMWTTFLAFSFTGTAWEALNGIINSPASVVEILATSLPSLASFFSSYVSFQALVTFPLMLLNPLGLIQWLIGGTASRGASGDRMRREQSAGGFPLDTTLTSFALVFVIGTTYTSINPVISPVCFLYFAVASWVIKHQTLYVNFSRFETGGMFLPRLVNRLFVGLIIYQLVMVGLLTLKTAAGPAAFIIPAPFITIFLWKYTAGLESQVRQLPIVLTQKPGLTSYAQRRRVTSQHRGQSCRPRDVDTRGGDAHVLAALNLIRWWIYTRERSGEPLNADTASQDWRDGVQSNTRVRSLASFQPASERIRAKAMRAASRRRESTITATPEVQASSTSFSTTNTDASPVHLSAQHASVIPVATRAAMRSVYLHPAMRPEFDTLLDDEDTRTSEQPTRRVDQEAPGAGTAIADTCEDVTVRVDDATGAEPTAPRLRHSTRNSTRPEIYSPH